MDDTAASPVAAAPVEITSWPHEFPLSAPIKVGENLVQVLVLNEPTAKDAFEFGLLTGLAPDQVRGLVSRLAVTPPPVIDKITAVDIIKLSGRLARFFNLAAA